MKEASAIKCEWSTPCGASGKPRSIALEDRKIDLNSCDRHWNRFRLGDFDPQWFGQLLIQLLRKE